MSDNLVIPPNNPGTGTPYANFSIGTRATDGRGSSISATSAINAVSDAHSFTPLPVNAQCSMSSVVTSFFAYGTTPSRYSLNNSNLNMGSLVNAQVLRFQLEVKGNTPTRYHTGHDGSIKIKLTHPNTWQRNNWTAIGAGPSTGSLSVFVNGKASASLIGQDPYGAGSYDVATALWEGFYSVKVVDNVSGFYYLIPTELPYSTNTNTYEVVPGRIRINNGSWDTFTSQNYV